MSNPAQELAERHGVETTNVPGGVRFSKDGRKVCTVGTALLRTNLQAAESLLQKALDQITQIIEPPVPDDDDDWAGERSFEEVETEEP